jgi:hypothetical protein
MEKLSYMPPEQVRLQLKQLLDHVEFKGSPTLAAFLEFVVDTKLTRHNNEITNYEIGVNVLNQPSNFNPLYNGVVETHASRLRNLLRRYYQGIGRNDVIVISIPKETCTPAFLLNA